QPTPEAPPGDEAPAGPIPSEESARRLSDEAVLEGLAHERAGRWEDARAAYDRALVAFAQNPHALAGLARERLAAEDAQAALRFAERASSFRRRRAEYRVLIGDAHRMAGDEAAARAEYEAALELDPNDAPALARLGRAAAPQPAP
ncbi:MAG: tetratricopeptide repeat protein, partial [Sandaracinaceae bacterium]|nr:tetratricopeptide repeat protein [Sandaracinaceae bacterium]